MSFGTAIPRFESWRPSHYPLGGMAKNSPDFSDRKEQTGPYAGTRVGTVRATPRPSRQEWPPILSQEIADAIAEREGRARRQCGSLKVVLAASLLLTAGACTDANTSPGERGNDGIRRHIWTDPATGCQYHF